MDASLQFDLAFLAYLTAIILPPTVAALITHQDRKRHGDQPRP